MIHHLCLLYYHVAFIYSLREALHHRILAQSNRIFEDQRAVTEWEDFFLNVTGQH